MKRKDKKEIENKKEVNINVMGSCKVLESSKDGYYVAELEYKGKRKYLTGEDKNTTSNRMIIKAFIEAISLLKEPCIINLSVGCPIGMRYIRTKSGQYKEAKDKAVNKDLLDQLKDLLESGKHEVIENITNENIEKLKKYREYIRSKQ